MAKLAERFRGSGYPRLSLVRRDRAVLPPHNAAVTGAPAEALPVRWHAWWHAWLRVDSVVIERYRSVTAVTTPVGLACRMRKENQEGGSFESPLESCHSYKEPLVSH